MNGARMKSVTAETLASEAQKLRDARGRIRFAYAWSPNRDEVEVRYLAAWPNQRDFEMWTMRVAHNVPSLARDPARVGWYEREMMDLNGVHFADHPEPYPLVLRPASSTQLNGHDIAGSVPSTGRSHLPMIDATDVQQLPFGPIRADVLESAEFTFFYVGEHIIHYQPRISSSNTAAWKSASKDAGLIRRPSSPNASQESGLSSTRSPFVRPSNARQTAWLLFAPGLCGFCSPSSNGSTIISTTLDICATPRR